MDSFLIHTGKKGDVIVSVGDVETYLWEKNQWYKSKEISDHWLDSKIYDSNVARFFGASEHKGDSRFPGVFSAAPDVMTISSSKPVLIATDGIKIILHEVSRRGSQRDDISVAVRL